jgi:branched-chain amino acid transport system substrate-binding protein
MKAVLAVGAAAMITGGTADAREIKIGFIAPKSGGLAVLGRQMEYGARLYLKLHGKELRGHTIKLIVRDSKNPGGAVAKAAAQELIARERVELITGLVFSPNAMSIAPLATKAKTPVLIMNAGTSWITKLSPYIARVSFSMWQSGYIMGQHAAKNLDCKVAVSGYTNYPPGKDSAAAFKRGFESAGGKVVDAIPMGSPRKVPDFTPFYQRAKDKKPDCFYVFVPAGNHAGAAVKTFKALGMDKAGIRLIGPGDITEDTQLQGMGPAAIGLVTTHHYNADLDTPENKTFTRAWKRTYGPKSTANFMGVQGYDGMAAIFHVIKAAKGGRITAAGAMVALKGWKFNSPRGPIMIDAETRDIVQNQYISIVTKKGGRLTQKVQGVFMAVRDQCKALKIGKCGK